MVLEQLDITWGKKRYVDTDLTSFTKNDSKQTVGLNGKC